MIGDLRTTLIKMCMKKIPNLSVKEFARYEKGLITWKQLENAHSVKMKK